jgi:hypothetical protein
MSKPVRILLLAGLVVFALIALWLTGQHSRSANHLQKYKAELIAKGEKLTFAALTQFRSTNSNGSLQAVTNAAAAILSLAGANSGPTPGSLRLREYIGPGLAKPVWNTDPPGLGAGSGRKQWTWADLTTEVQAVAPVLQQLRDVMKDPDADAGPIVQIWGARRIDFVAIRTIAQWLMGASLVEVRQGHLEEALQDLEALIGMARMERDEYTMVAQMIRISISTLGTSTTWELLQAPGWTEPQLERLQKAWERVDLLDAAEKAFLGERAVGGELWAQLRSPTNRGIWQVTRSSRVSRRSFDDLVGDYIIFPAYKLTSMDNDEFFHLRSMQDSIGALRLLQQHQTWGEAQRALDKVFARVNEISSSPKRYRYLFSMMSIPNFSRAAQNAIRGETERRLTVAVLALTRFQMRHGKFPSRLNELVPEFLAAEPYDPMSGKGLVYRLKPDGSFVLYSVGEDGIDNGGDATPTAGKKPGFWDGLDAVWPAAAAAPQ